MNDSSPPLKRLRTAHRTESQLLHVGNGPHWGDLVAAAVVVLVFSVVAGLAGSVAGVVTAAVLFRLGSPYALAIAVVFLVGLTPDGIGPATAALAGIGLLALLLSPTATTTRATSYAITVLFTTAVFGAFTWLLVNSQPLWLTASLLLAAVAVIMYGLHRYQQLRLGLLDEDANNELQDEPVTRETNEP